VATYGVPSAGRLLKRLTTLAPDSALEGLGLPEAAAAAPMADAQSRLEVGRRRLLHLAAGTSDVDEATVDRIIQDAEEALRKLDDDGENAVLTKGEAFGLEAVIESDGSRPVLFLQDGSINLDAPELQGSLSARWKYDAARFLGGIKKVAASVGAVQLPAFGNKRFGTAFVIAPGLVVTNRHVLEEAAQLVNGVWQWRYAVEVDFSGEYQRPSESCFPLGEVVFVGPDPINRRINFSNLDLAVIRVSGDLANLPAPLSFEGTVDRVAVRDDRQPPIYVVGFPAQPLLEPGKAGNAAPRAGHEYEEILEKLYKNRFGSKRWAPGLVEAGAGQLAGDTRKWIMSHDASTLGGNSGSCVVDFGETGERVVGVHFGGRPRVENYAHVVAALRESLDAIEGISWA